MRSTRMYLPELPSMVKAVLADPSGEALPEPLSRAFSRAQPLPAGSIGERRVPHARRAVERLYQQLLQVPSPCPRAALARLGEGRDPGQALWVIGQPVSLRPDLQSVYLVDHRPAGLEESDLDAIHASLAGLFDEPDQVFERSSMAARWYLSPGEAFAGRHAFDNPRHCLGGDLGRILPRGEHQAPWHRLMNETQMALHQHPVNLRRQQQGQAPVSSLWFWGAGRLPEFRAGQSLAGPEARLHGNGSLAAGLARLAGVTQLAGSPVEAGESFGSGEDWCLFRPDYELSAQDNLAVLVRDWLEPALEALDAGRCEQIELHSDDGIALQLGRRDWRRWLHRQKDLAAVLGIGPHNAD